MSLAAVQDELKTLLRGLLISSPRAMTIDELQRDYRLQEGQDVPFHKLGYKSFLEYLKSVPDTVVIQPSFRGDSPIVVPVQSEKSSHIDVLVQKQKVQPPKRSFRFKPQRRLSVKLPPETNRRNCINNYNNSSDVKQKVLVPHSLQQRIYKMLHENPQGVPLQTIEREFCSTQTLQNYGIYDGGGVYQILNCLGHLLEVSKGMVYPLQNSEPVYRPKAGDSVIDYQKPDSSNSGTSRFLPTGYGSHNDFHSKQNGAVEEDNELEWKINNEDEASISEEVRGRLGAGGDVSNTKEKTEEDVKVIPNSSSLTPDISTYINAYTSDIVSEKMKLNFRVLLDKHPGGIWCSELPHLYEEEFRVVLDYVSLGFVSVIQMVSDLSDVFHCIRQDGTDWKLFDARKKLPPQYSSYDMKSNQIVSTKMVPSVPSKVKNNIVRLLTYHSSGIPSDQFLNRYKEVFLTSFNIQEMGFDTVESFLLSLNDTVLHMRYVNKKILVYPHAFGTEPELGNPLPHITEPQDIFPDLYKPEVIGPKGTIPYEKIPLETTPGGFLEVLVAEVYTPQNFWIQLRGEKTHLALDKLMNDIQEFYNQEAQYYRMPDLTVRIGQYCMAPYNEELHRACITAVHNLTDAQVLFVDYGTSSRVKKNELLFMHQDFTSFPIQAIKASLVNLMPADDAKRWPREVSTRFLELVSDKNLIAVVSSVDHETYEAKMGRLYYRRALVALVHEVDFQARRLEVALVDTCGDEDVHINDALVNEGLAEYKTNRQPSPPPPPQRIDADLAPPTVTVSRPPPGFAVGSQLQRQSSLSPTGSTAPAQSTTVTEIQGQSYPQSPLPNMPRLNANASNFIPQSTNVPVAPPLYDISMFANPNSFPAQASLLQPLLLYDHYLQHQQLMTSLMMSNPTFAYMVSQHITAASLANQFGVPRLNPAMLCTPTAIADIMANAGQSQLNISEVGPMSSPNSPSDRESSPPIIDKSSVSTKLLTGDSVATSATSGTGTKERSSVISPGVSYLPVSGQINPQMCTDVHNDLQLTVGSIGSQKEVTVVSQVRDEEKQNKYVVVSEAYNNAVCTEFTSSLDTVKEKSYMMKSDPDVIVERECMNGGGETNPDLSVDSDDIYRSDDDIEEDEQEQWCVLEPHYVKKTEIARRMVHLINVSNTAFLCTEEIIRLFTDFSGRHVVLKILASRHVVIPFREIGRKDEPVIIEALDFFNIVGVPKNALGYIQGKVHLVPLRSVPHLLTLLDVKDRGVLRAVQEEVEKFDPNDIYWTGKKVVYDP